MRGPLRWSAAAAVSLAVHAAGLGLLALAVAPRPAPQQDAPPMRLEIAAQGVPRSEARATEPVGDRPAEAQAASARVQGAAVPVSRARPADPQARTAPPTPQRPNPVTARAPLTALLRPAAPGAAPTAGTAVPAAAAAARPPFADSAAPLTLPPGATLRAADGLASVEIDGARPVSAITSAASQTLAPLGARLGGVAPQTVLAAVLGMDGDIAPAPTAEGRRTDARPPEATRVQDAPPAAQAARPTATAALADAAPAPAAPAARVTAALAWTGGRDSRVDPVSLAAIQSFMQPGDTGRAAASVGTVRDDIAAILGGVPCARLQTRFLPETGALELHGHVPDPGLRAPVLAALRAQVGPSIPLADNLRILPRPSCGVLGGIAATGLAQSVEQLRDPRVVGPDAHARVYRFAAGETLGFELTAPDYPAYVYLDYFDAEGMVLHLQPNAFVPLDRIDAKARLAVGRGTGLEIRVTPPFGQEILVAFAASVPLYEGLRPLQEPAAEYLTFLRDRVVQARARTPDFKGEWVYFLVETRP